jgi:hypothetical protein
MEIILSVLIPALLLLYFIRTDGENKKQQGVQPFTEGKPGYPLLEKVLKRI